MSSYYILICFSDCFMPLLWTTLGWNWGDWAIILILKLRSFEGLTTSIWSLVGSLLKIYLRIWVCCRISAGRDAQTCIWDGQKEVLTTSVSVSIKENRGVPVETNRRDSHRDKLTASSIPQLSSSTSKTHTTVAS